MEIDSKPEQLDKLERRLIQLKIEREAVRKDKDEASLERLKILKMRSINWKKISQKWKKYGNLKKQPFMGVNKSKNN